jgi:cell division protein FtsX
LNCNVQIRIFMYLNICMMDSKQIEEQISAIRAVTAKGMESKESAIRILTEAGILKNLQSKKKIKKKL